MHFWETIRQRLEGRPIELGLDRVGRVADAGQLIFLAVTLIVGGTNGKGSTCAYLEKILRCAGYRVGCYTSPHLFTFGERIRVDGQLVDDWRLDEAFVRVLALPGAESLTQFEMDTLVALAIFKAEGVDAMILEVGLGGRLDATNVLDADVAIVTSVGIDHVQFLGPDRESIGFEKAGIYRPGKPAFCADPNPPQSLLEHAAAIGADLRLIGRDFGFARDAGAGSESRMQWRWWCRSGGRMIRRTLAYPGLRGVTQLRNAAVALAALDALGERLPVTMQAIRTGLIATELPGRFQVIPGKPAIVFDVGHNPQAIEVLADNLASMGFFDRTHAVVGMLGDKDIRGALQPLRGKVDFWHAATLDGPRGTRAESLAAVITAGRLGGEVICHDSPRVAMQAAKGQAAESDRIVVFGSFLTVAGALEALRAKP